MHHSFLKKKCVTGRWIKKLFEDSSYHKLDKNKISSKYFSLAWIFFFWITKVISSLNGANETLIVHSYAFRVIHLFLNDSVDDHESQCRGRYHDWPGYCKVKFSTNHHKLALKTKSLIITTLLVTTRLTYESFEYFASELLSFKK